METISYNNDFAGWAFQQAELMRAGKLDSLDIANLIEEMECMGRSITKIGRASCRERV